MPEGRMNAIYTANTSLQRLLTSDAHILDEIFNFKDTDCCVGQDATVCAVMVQLLSAVCESISKEDKNVLFGSVDCGLHAQGCVQACDSLGKVLSNMKSARHVLWAPRFAVALIAAPRDEPYADTKIEAVCLDGWEKRSHRNTELGCYTATSVCKGRAIEPVKESKPDVLSLQQVEADVLSALKGVKIESRTAGFFVDMATQAVEHQIMLKTAPVDSVSEEQKQFQYVLHQRPGGYRDLGQHTTADPLPTCWPLVEHTFHFLAGQEPSLDSQAVVATFFTIIAHLTSTQLPHGAADTSTAAASLNRAMGMLEIAACKLGSLSCEANQGPLADKLKSLVTAARAALDESIEKEQEDCNAAAGLRPISYKSGWDQMRPFGVELPAMTVPTADASCLHTKAIDNLCPITFPSIPASIADLVTWSRILPATDLPKQQALQFFHEVETWFFITGVQSFKRDSTLSQAAQQEELRQAHQLVLAYSKQLQAFEKRHCHGYSCDVHTPESKVGPRSREAVVVWVMLCMSHSLCAAEFPGVRKYALPVQPDDLRHLVLDGRNAGAVIKSVEHYIAALNCTAAHGQIFSTRPDKTQQLTVEFFEISLDLQARLQEEQALQRQRSRAHWIKVQEMQRRVDNLKVQLRRAEVDEVIQKEHMQQAMRDLIRGRDAADVNLHAKRAQRQSCSHEELTAANLKHDLNCQSRHQVRTALGKAWHEAKHSVSEAKSLVDDLKHHIKCAKQPPQPLLHAMPSTTDHPAACRMLLFFLYPQHTGSFPLLRQYCCAAQQCLVPLSASRTPDATTNADDSLEPWVAFYNKIHTSCVYRDGGELERKGQVEGSDQLRIFRRLTDPPKPGNDVMQYGPGDGVHYPFPDVGTWRWMGGPVARYTSAKFTDPFSHQDSVNVAASFVDPGAFQSWLQLATPKQASKLCVGSQCGPYCSSRHNFQDTEPSVEAARGNMVLAKQDERPLLVDSQSGQGMTAEQWQAFASLRAYPLQQLRVLCVALREGRLQLDSPQVASAVRLSMYHVGPLELRNSGPQSWLQRVWQGRDEDYAALCSELLSLADIMEPAPKRMLEGPLLCEIAAHVAERDAGGKDAARRVMSMASSWAESFANTHRGLGDSAAKDHNYEHGLLQTKAALAHCCACLCLSWAADSTSTSSVGKAAMKQEDAAALCLHRTQAYLRTFHDGSNELQPRLATVTHQTSRLFASLIHALDSAARQHPGEVLTPAVKRVFRSLPMDVEWERSKAHVGCFTAQSQGQVYSINLLTGCVLCNGLAPGHLPRAVVEHSSYVRLFGNDVFEVEHLAGEQQGKFRTVQSYGGHVYTFELQGLELYVAECPVDAETGERQQEFELELLQADCKWAPGLPCRLKTMHSHWCSRAQGVIVLRGERYMDRRVHFMLTPCGYGFMKCYIVPPHMQDEIWHSIAQPGISLGVLWHFPVSDDPVVCLLERFESRKFIHVTTTESIVSSLESKESTEDESTSGIDTGATSGVNSDDAPLAAGEGRPKPDIVFHLPRFHLSFKICPITNGGLQRQPGVLHCQDFAGYHIGSHDRRASALPLTRFQSFLTLQPSERTMPVKVLVPDGAVERQPHFAKCTIATSGDSTCSNLSHHLYSFNRRTLGLETAHVRSRLFLAAIYAATHSEVPLPQLGMTGGEQAVELLRRSWVNRPLSKGEEAARAAAEKHSSHTPSLQLLCQGLVKDSESLAFLYPTVDGEAENVECKQKERLQREASCMYQQEAKRILPFVHARRKLAKDEEHLCAARSSTDTQPVQQVLTWDTIVAAVAAKVDVELPLLNALRRGEYHIHAGLFTQVQQLSSEFVSERLGGEDCKAVQAQAHADLRGIITFLRDDSFGSDLADGLEESLEACSQAGADQHVEEHRLPDLAAKLSAVASDVESAERNLSAILLAALRVCPESPHGAAVSAFQAAALIAKPAQADLLCITLFPEALEDLNPLLSSDARTNLTALAQEWQKLCILQDKIDRCLRRCFPTESTDMDLSTTALAAELANRRIWDPQEQPGWLALEVLQGLEIRERQATVAQHMLQHPGGPGLADEDRGAILQLNMGEGKTRVILPMLVLALCGKGELPRLNFLQELLHVAADNLHACLTGSLLGVKQLLLPFRRAVKPDQGCLSTLHKQLKFCGKLRAFVCVSREDRQCLALKAQEVYSSPTGHDGAYQEFKETLSVPEFDILDECDEILSCKNQLVYAWGEKLTLPSLLERVHIMQATLWALCSPSVLEILADGSIALVNKQDDCHGSVPAVRLLQGEKLDDTWPHLSKSICLEVMKNGGLCHRDLEWLSLCGPASRDILLKCCTDVNHGVEKSMQSLQLSQEQQSSVWMLRGLLACKILRHCLQMRFNVEYGSTNRLPHTPVAVPFEAAGIASLLSNFKQPDVEICLTMLTYLQQGLTEEQLRECLKALSDLKEPSTQESHYRSFIETSEVDLSGEEDRIKFATINSLEKVDRTNSVQMQVLHKFLRHNSNAIHFWLETVVFPKHTKVFLENLRQTAWHILETVTGKVACFSGTNDKWPITPPKVCAHDLRDLSITGTNARMMLLLLQPYKCSFAPLSGPGDKGLTPTDAVLDLAIREQADAIIDAGAQLADVRQHTVALRLLDRMCPRGRDSVTRGRLGVVFFENCIGSQGRPQQTEGWNVMDLQKRCLPTAQSPIREADAFVIFDEARCRGSDMKLKPGAKGILTLGSKMGKDKFMQAAARLRQLDKNQSLIIAAPADICASIKEVCKLDQGAAIQVKDVLKWVARNSAQANAKAFPEYLYQGRHFAYSVGKPAFVDQEKYILQDLYSNRRIQTTSELVGQPMRKDGKDIVPSDTGKQVLRKLEELVEKRGESCLPTETGTAEECQREVLQETEQQQQAQQEEQAPRLKAIEEGTWSNPAAAMMLDTALHVPGSQNIKLMRLHEAATYLRSEPGEAVSHQQMNWAANVYVTQNFVSLAVGHGAMAIHVNLADNMLLFRDGSVLLISEREAEHLLSAVRAKPAESLAVCLVNLAMCRWSVPIAGGDPKWGPVPLALGNLPDSAVGDLTTPCSIVCVQLFNGETKFQRGCDTRAVESGRRDALIATVFGTAWQKQGAQKQGRAVAEQRRYVAKRMVVLRGREICWRDSDLERICTREVNLAESSRG